MTIKKAITISMMLAMAIVLSIVESFIPLFVPGVKLGLANVIILLMLYEYKWYEALLTNLLRILLVGILRGTLLGPTFMMSLGGGLLSFLVMFIFSKIKVFSPIGVSILGSLSHCTGQIIVAMIILSASAVVYYLPFIAILSLGTGVFSGLICNVLLKRKIIPSFEKNNQ